MFRLKKWHTCHFFSLKTFDFRLIHLNSSLSCNILHQNWKLSFTLTCKHHHAPIML